MRLSMLGAPGTIVFKGVCPGGERDQYEPLVIVRRRGPHATFIALYAPRCAELTLSGEVDPTGAIVCRVVCDGAFTDVLMKQDAAQNVALDNGVSSSAPLAYVRRAPDGEVVSHEEA